MPPSAPPNFRENKEALRGLTKIAAKEWGQYGICVNIVLPGAESPAAKAWAEKFPEEYAKQVNLNPMKRFGDPEMDIAPVVTFLAGPDSCYFSGQSVIVDGANSIMPQRDPWRGARVPGFVRIVTGFTSGGYERSLRS